MRLYIFRDFIYETKSTPSEVLDMFDDRAKKIKENGIIYSVEKTKGSWKVVATDNGKSIGRIYIQEIKPNGKGGYKAQLRRLNVSDTHRGKGIGRRLLEIAIDSFKDLDLYGHASPNRNKDMDDDNFEEYRERLKKFYSSVGLKSVGPGHRVEKSSTKNI